MRRFEENWWFAERIRPSSSGEAARHRSGGGLEVGDEQRRFSDAVADALRAAHGRDGGDLTKLAGLVMASHRRRNISSGRGSKAESKLTVTSHLGDP